MDKEMEDLLDDLGSGEPSPDYRMPETLNKMLAFEAEISPLAPYLDGLKGNKGE